MIKMIISMTFKDLRCFDQNEYFRLLANAGKAKIEPDV